MSRSVSTLTASISKYRADIDGLRALAIVPVVLYHFGMPGAAGGFVGVDVFFVISGYLITGVIVQEIRDGSFTVAGFYERRIRRIFPALVVVTLAAFAIGCVLLAPVPLKELGSEMMWSSFFATNISFFRKSGYFDGTAEMRPLLHSWSLAVEEQFYIVIPLLLRWTTAPSRSRDRTLLCFVIVFAVSLLLSVVAVDRAPTAGFYLLPSRAWELLCGGILAVGGLPKPGRLAAELSAGAGCAAILIAVLAFTAGTPFPGIAALLPCLGATALIWAGESNSPASLSRLMSSPVPVWIGKISYPLYMWHWPLLVLARHGLFHEPTAAERLGLAVLAVVLAAATTRWIEAPIRGRRIFAGGRETLMAGFGAMLVLFAIGKATSVTLGFPERLPADALALARQDVDLAGQFCNATSHVDLGIGTTCEIGDWGASQAADFVVWGDSHALAEIPAFAIAARQHGQHGLIFGQASCEPLLGVSDPDPEGVACRDFNAAVVGFLKARPAPTVFLVALWARVAEGRPVPAICAGRGGENGGVIDVVAGITSGNGSHAAFDNGLGRSLAFLNGVGITPILLQDTPCQFTEVPAALAMAATLHRSLSGIEEKRTTIDASQAWVDSRLAAASAAGRARFLRTRDAFCGPETCPVAVGSAALYRDSSHLTVTGALRLVPVLDQMLAAPPEYP